MPRLGRLLRLVFIPFLLIPTRILAQTDMINADRPGIADGSRVLGRFGVQLEFGVEQDFKNQQNEKTRETFVPALLRIGLGSHLEARFETNSDTWTRITDPATGTARDHGWAPTSGGLKYTFADNCRKTDVACDLRHSFGVIVRYFPRSGSGDDASHHATADVRLTADWDLSQKFSLNPNVGVARSESDDGQVFTQALAALTLTWEPSQKLNPFIDAGYQHPAAPGERGSLTVDGGVAWILCTNVQLDASFGGGSRNSAPRPFWSVGLSIRKLKRPPVRR